MSESANPIERELLGIIKTKKDKIQRVIRRYESCAEDIEDIFQCTIFEAYKNLPKFNSESKLETWVIGIALNVTRQHIKKEIQRKSNVMSVEDTSELEVEVSSHHNPEKDLEVRQMISLLEEEISRIPDEIMKTFSLFSEGNHSYKEISSILDIPIGTVRSRIFNAKKFLARGLAKQST